MGDGDFRCTDAAQCGPNAAYCEPTGRCSFAVATSVCASGRRYGGSAGDLGGRCVDDACPGPAVVALAGGAEHACLLRADGSVACWGANDSGQLGDGTTTPRANPRDVALPAAATEIAAGASHTCALLSSASVACWGANDSGQLGDGTQAASATPVLVGLPGLVPRHLAAGGAFTCAVVDGATAMGDVVCWGDNVDGETGAGGAGGAVPAPGPTLGLSDATRLAAGAQHACAVSGGETGTGLWCWGNDSVGQLGDGTTVASRGPTAVAGLPGPVTAIAAGGVHTCALAGGQLACWGGNQAGQLGDGNADTAPLPEPVALDGVEGVTAGAAHTCARRDDGSVWCWGNNDQGQIGDGTTGPLALPAPIAVPLEATALIAGTGYTCGLATGGRLWCWGDNREGQLALGNDLFVAMPSPVATSLVITQIAAGGAHTCALAAEGTPVCWGENTAGQLGVGDVVDRATPTALKVSLAATSLAAGALHTCAVQAGDVYCWGRGADGQLATPSLIDYRVPVAAQGLGLGMDGDDGVVEVEAGGAHTCARRDDGSVWCWGLDDHGQLGDGASGMRATPEAITGLAATALALGDAHSCALAPDQTVACWGRGSEGQLGDGLDADAATPTAVTYLPPAMAVTAGGDHSCALATDGTVWCWGDGAAGELGQGAYAGSDTPVAVPALVGAIAVAAGAAHTCALLGAGAPEGAGHVTCWGDDHRGQLGASGGGFSASPTAVPGVDDAVAIATGGEHTCARRAGGGVVCFGANTDGQLGLGTPLQFTTPQPASTCSTAP